MAFLARLRSLVHGMAVHWLGRREHRNPAAVYEAAIAERLDQYTKLREAAAGVLYLRRKLADDLARTSAELARLTRQLDLAVDHDDDGAALALLKRRSDLAADVDRLTTELSQLTAEAATAKNNLVAFQDGIARLRDEKVRMLARLANARARLRLHDTLSGLSAEADIRALDGVRQHVERLVAEVELARGEPDPDLAHRLAQLRTAEADAAARAELNDLKRRRKRVLLPVVMPRPA